MGRQIDPSDLVGAEQARERLGIGRVESFNAMVSRFGPESATPFPEPVLRGPRVRVWVWPDIDAWCRRTGLPKTYRLKLLAEDQ